MLFHVAGFVAGLLWANAGEWWIHRFVLHGLGKRRASFWSFHFHEHHQAARRHDMIDADYHRSLFGWHAQSKEAAALVGAGLVHTPLAWVSPGFALGVWCNIVAYYLAHRRAHLDPDWGRTRLPWHYDHHMGPDQDLNWCVTWPGFDRLVGTRAVYRGTPREEADREKRRARAERSAPT